MKRQVVRVVAGANLVAGCLLMQGCGLFGARKTEEGAGVTTIPGEGVAVAPVVETAPVVEAAPVEPLPVVASTTPYTVQKDDTITAVAYKYGLRWQDVVAVNPGISPNRLRIGQVIQLPGQVDLSKPRHVPVSTPKVSAPKTASPVKAPAVAGPTVTYVVKNGDSLSVIAYKHGSTVSAIRDANNLKGDRITVGQKLKVPGAKKTPAADTEAKKPAATAAKTEPPKKPAVETKPVVVPPPVVAPAVTTPAPVAPGATDPAPVAAPVVAPGATEAAPVAAPAASNVQVYTVKEGEDLYAVAIRWGVSPSDLKTLNNLSSNDLKAGMTLKIPGGVQ